MSVQPPAVSPYNQSIQQLTDLSKQLGENKPEDMLLCYNKETGKLFFEKKSILGSIKRFFTVTLFRSDAYNFDTNMQKLNDLFEPIRRQGGLTEADQNTINPLQQNCERLITHVVTKKNTIPFWKFWARSSRQDVDTKISELKTYISTATPPSSSISKQVAQIPVTPATTTATSVLASTQLEGLRKQSDSLTFAQRRDRVMTLANAIKKEKDVKNEALDNVFWLARESAAFFDVENAFSLHQLAAASSIHNADTAQKLEALVDRRDFEQFIEVSLSAKKFTELEAICTALDAKKTALVTTKKTAQSKKNFEEKVSQKVVGIQARTENIKSFGRGLTSTAQVVEGKKTTAGFTEKEWQMLTRFATTFELVEEDKEGGVLRLKNQATEFRDFMIYACGNKGFNDRLKAQETLINSGKHPTIKDANIISAIEYFATYTFKSDLKKWQTNQILCQHAQAVTKLYQTRERVEKNTALLEKLETPLPGITLVADDKAKALTGSAAYKDTQSKYRPAKKGKFTQTKGGWKTKTQTFQAIAATTPKEWKKSVDQKTEQDRLKTIEELKLKIAADTAQIPVFVRELADLKKFCSAIIEQNPEKLQPDELYKLDSIVRFRDQLNSDMRETLKLDANPFLAAQYEGLDRLHKGYIWIQDECQRAHILNTGDMSFVNEHKKLTVTGKKAQDFTDRAAQLLFPFGHMALIDEMHGHVSFSHQLLQFDHSELSLAEYLYYDSYRIDFSTCFNDAALPAFKEILAEKRGVAMDVIDTDIKAKGIAEKEYLLQALEEEYESILQDVLEQKGTADADKWIGVEKPDIEKFKSLENVKQWLNKVNQGKAEEKKLTLYDVLELTQDLDDDEIAKIQELRTEYLQELYKGISNNEETQKKAFLQSWKFATPIGQKVTRVRGKAVDPERMQVEGEMC